MKRQRYIFFFLAVFVASGVFSSVMSQEPDTVIRIRTKSRTKLVFVGQAAAYTIATAGLNELWYKNFERSSFHFFNDSKEWQHMDKAGHLYSTYWLSMYAYQMYRWAGITSSTSAAGAALAATACVSTVEILDGFSRHWGASYPDFIANVSGASVFYVQQSWWGQQKLVIKYSYYTSRYASRRPDELGSNLPQKVLKDYNAQTYWLSVNLASTSGVSWVPRWLNVAGGYGADGMTGAITNIDESKRRRLYYVSLDVDLSRLKLKNKYLRRLVWMANMVKVPFFTLAFSGGSPRVIIK